jgi:iron complex transport system substrate-binding protein
MRLWPALLALAATGCGTGELAAPPRPTHPLRVMSLNLCTDQLVLALLPPARIASVTWLARDPSGSVMTAAARRVAANHGTIEEVLAQSPDLVIADAFAAPALRDTLRRLGYPLVEVNQATTIDEIRHITRQVGDAVGEPARAERLVRAMDEKFAYLSAHPGPPLRVLAWGRDGPAADAGTLQDRILAASGARNLAPVVPHGGRPDVETLLAANPAQIVQAPPPDRSPSLGDSIAHHPLVRRYWGDRTLTVPAAYHACGTPMIADAALALGDQLRSAVARGHTGPAIAFGTVR